jgi:hypothetical protein
MDIFDASAAGLYTIDSTTPFLWLPKAVCQKFADAFGLTYNDTLNLYTFDAQPSQHDILQSWDMEFTFSLKDTLASSEVVNITLPYAAFDLELTYPYIANTTYLSTQASKYYFPLRQTDNDTQYTLGRAFLQESYIISNYDTNTFSLHQAIHTTDPVNNVSIVDITSISAIANGTARKEGFSSGAIAGVSVGAVAFVSILGLGLFMYTWRRRSRKANAASEEKLGGYTSSEPSSPRTPLSPFLSRLFHREANSSGSSRTRSSTIHETTGSSSYARELGAETNEIYELPAPIGRAELDSESGSMSGSTTEVGGTTSTLDVSPYERMRRKIEDSMAVRVAPPTHQEAYQPEKSESDVSAVPHYRPNHEQHLPSPLSSPISDVMSDGQPSPISPPPTYTRHRIDPSNVVYVGRLPDNIRAPGPAAQSISDDSGSGSAIPSSGVFAPASTFDSLGSRYTEMENEELASSVGVRQRHIYEILNPWGDRGRIDGEDLIHVPQPAERRFSWEEDAR